jgi:hypothetical protein
MRAALALLIGWLLVALVLLALDGRLGRPGVRSWALGSGRWSASSAPTPCSTSHPARTATGSPTTSTRRWPPWSPPPSTTPLPHQSSNHRGHRRERAADERRR